MKPCKKIECEDCIHDPETCFEFDYCEFCGEKYEVEPVERIIEAGGGDTEQKICMDCLEAELKMLGIYVDYRNV